MIRVVLVDDQAIVRAGLRTLLGVEPDIEVVGEAATGQEGIQAVARFHPDLALVDIRMPGMDGIAATRRIVGAVVPARVCVITNYGNDDYLFDALEAGASGFLLKTDTPERIVATVRAVAAGEFALGAEATGLLVSKYRSHPRPRVRATAVAGLTPREHEVLLLVADGLTNAEIAERLVLGEGTVKTHVAHILAKLGLRDRVQAAVLAHRAGLAH